VLIGFRLTVLLLALASGAARPTAQNPEGAGSWIRWFVVPGFVGSDSRAVERPNRRTLEPANSRTPEPVESPNLRTSNSQASQVRLIEFEVVARQFEFAPSLLEVSQGDKVRIRVRSEDRNHGFAIRKLKIDKILPASGKVVTIEFEAKDAGTFEIICSESCGDGHKEMKGSLVVLARPRPETDEAEPEERLARRPDTTQATP
jgi:cytochrome c oxidase subunit 2